MPVRFRSVAGGFPARPPDQWKLGRCAALRGLGSTVRRDSPTTAPLRGQLVGGDRYEPVLNDACRDTRRLPPRGSSLA